MEILCKSCKVVGKRDGCYRCEIADLKYRLARAEKMAEWALGTVQWMSGSNDFAPGGKAHKGYVKAMAEGEKIRAEKS